MVFIYLIYFRMEVLFLGSFGWRISQPCILTRMRLFGVIPWPWEDNPHERYRETNIAIENDHL